MLRREIVRRGRDVVHERPGRADRSDPELLTQTSLEQVTANRDFREVAEFFKSVRYLRLVPQLVREPDRSVGRVNDPFGGDFLEQVARTSNRKRESRLRRITRALKVAVLQLDELTWTPTSVAPGISEAATSTGDRKMHGRTRPTSPTAPSA